MLQNEIQSIIPKLDTVEGASALLRELGYGAFLEEPYECPDRYWHIERRETGELEPLAKSGHVIATPGEKARLYSYFYELNDGSCDRFGKIKIGAFRPIAEKHARDVGVPLIFFASPKGENSDEVVLATFTHVGKVGEDDRIALRWVRFHRDAPEARTPLDVVGKLGFNLSRHLREIILSAFALEPLTDTFYNEYKKIFEELKGELAKQLKLGKEENELRAHEFASLLMNRLMFLWFVQKKGWLDGKQDYLLRLFENYDDANFYSDRIQQVFEMLNDPKNDLLRKRIERDNSFDTGQLPFLNGGLFDELDMNEQTSRDKGTLKIGDHFFKNIFHNLFAKYNFTVEESTPLNIEIAVDPEMLGHVFERMVTGRHESGSYYTPKGVVNFMCKEALKGYLKTSTHESGEAITALVEGGNRKELRDYRQVSNMLEKMRVCDPACGSGAYLLGMMHSLIALQKALYGSGELHPSTVHSWKLEMISHNIYGVDIDPFAVSIAKLRLWLSLVVDEIRDPLGDDKPDVALPNLEFKIEAGDSLTAPNPTDKDYTGDMFEQELLKLADELGEMKDRFLQAHDGKTKRELRERIIATENRLTECIEAERKLPENAFDWRIQFAEVFKRDGFDIVIANPPYGANIASGLRDIYFPNESQSKDSFGIFIIRGLQLLKPNGIFSYIVSDTWRTIRTHKPLRKRLFENTTVFHVLDVPSWIFGATVNTTILTLRSAPAKDGHKMVTGDLRGIPNGEWGMLSENLRKIAGNAEDEQNVYFARYTYPQSKVGEHENLPFFIGSPDIFRVMSEDKFVKLGDIATIVQGLATADNKFYLRKDSGVRGGYEIINHELVLTDEELENLSEDEKRNGLNPKKYGGRHFVPYDKGGESDAEGGWLPNYYVPTGYYIDWSKESVDRMKTLTIADRKRYYGEKDKIKRGDENRIASRFQNNEYYFEKGLTFSDTGIYSPTFRINASSVFDQKGSAIIPKKNKSVHSILGFAASICAKYLFKIYINHTVSSHVDCIKELRIIESNRQLILLEKLVKSIIKKQKHSHYYEYFENEQPEIDRIVYGLYGLSEEEIAEVEIWYCRRYSKLAKAWGLWDKYAERTGEKGVSESKLPGSENDNFHLRAKDLPEQKRMKFEEPDKKKPTGRAVHVTLDEETKKLGEVMVKTLLEKHPEFVEVELVKSAPIDLAPEGRNARYEFFMWHILATMHKGKAYTQDELLRAALQRLRGKNNVRLTEKARAELEPALKKAIREGKIEKTKWADEYRKV